MPPGPIHLSTILSQTPAGLLNHLTRLSAQYGNKGHTVLFTLSANFPRSEDLQAVVKKLTNFNDVPDLTSVKRTGMARGNTLGCLSDSFAAIAFPKFKSAGTSDVLSCSVGIFDSAHCIPFHSELAGRTQPQVGRWHAFRKQNDDTSSEDYSFGESGRQDWERMKDSGDGEVNWENIWNRSTKSSPTSLSSLLPESLKKSSKSSQIRALVSLSSSHPDTFTRVLSEYISSNKQATSLTLVAAPTHFVTGRAVTLFMDGEIYSEGAVGLALLNKSGILESSKDTEEAQNAEPSFRTEFAGMTKLSGPMTVTRREGNMINSLNNSNPTGLLLSALDLAAIGAAKKPSSSSPFASTFKEDEQFALGLLGPSGTISETYKITAGDPSSRGGSLSLDAPKAPGIGSVVQFLHCPANTPLALSSDMLSSSTDTDAPKTLAFLSVPEIVAQETSNCSDLNHVFENMFIAPSTQGFIVLRPSTSTLSIPEDATKPVEVRDAPSEPWSCSLPGGIALLEW